MDNAPVQTELDGHVATVAMNDPDRRNALGLAMFDALDEAIAGVSSNTAVHVILLCGRGKSFCAGFDLAAAMDDPAIMAEFIRRLSAVLRALRRAPQPVVAAVHGAAMNPEAIPMVSAPAIPCLAPLPLERKAGTGSLTTPSMASPQNIMMLATTI